jgi:DNA-binding transcriptional ArsR family regulator
MDMFSALAEPTRRNIVEILAKNGELSATDISDRFKTSAPAISQHLKVLREAKLVQMEKRAQQRIYKVNTNSILELESWVHKITGMWNKRFEALDKVLEEEKSKMSKSKLQISNE